MAQPAIEIGTVGTTGGVAWVTPGGIVWQFLVWLADRPRSYAEAMEAWRTSCPRLSVWEDAIADDLVWIDTEPAASQSRAIVRLTEKGIAAMGFAQAPDPQLASSLPPPAHAA